MKRLSFRRGGPRVRPGRGAGPSRTGRRAVRRGTGRVAEREEVQSGATGLAADVHEEETERGDEPRAHQEPGGVRVPRWPDGRDRERPGEGDGDDPPDLERRLGEHAA